MLYGLEFRDWMELDKRNGGVAEPVEDTAMIGSGERR